MSAGIEVKEFKHIPGVNDAEYIKKLEELREIDKGIINTAVAKIKKLSAQLSAQPEIKKDGDTISRQAAIDALRVAYWDDNIQSAKDDPCIVDAMTDWAIRQVKALPSAQPDFDITVKIDKAYDDGYEAGYLQGRHDWGDFDE